jgi:hypothetical protein
MSTSPIPGPPVLRRSANVQINVPADSDEEEFPSPQRCGREHIPPLFAKVLEEEDLPPYATRVTFCAKRELARPSVFLMMNWLQELKKSIKIRSFQIELF